MRGYAFLRDGKLLSRTSDPGQSSATFSLPPEGRHLFEVQVLGKPLSARVFVGPNGAGCFSSPGACGYPDPAYGNVGVPAGTTLTASGPITVTTPGTVINGMDITASGGNPGIHIDANNVTVKNTRITMTGGGCGTPWTTTTLSCASPIVIDGASGTVIKNVELTTDANTTAEFGIVDDGETAEVDSVYQHGNIDSLAQAYGPMTFNNDYSIIDLYIASDHLENIYLNNGQVTVNHSTLINLDGQTATIFANTNDGSGGACSNNVTATNNLLIGGGYTIYSCANSSSIGSSKLDFEGNMVARCHGHQHEVQDTRGNGSGWLCSGSSSYCPSWVPGAAANGHCPAVHQVEFPPGSDAYGFFAKGGYFGLDVQTYCPSDSATQVTWKNNVWIGGATASC